MSRKWWISVLGTIVGITLALSAEADGFKSLMHPGKNQDQAQVCIKQQAWMAYLRDDDGKLSPVRSTQDTNKDQDWLGLRFSDYDGPRIRLGVLTVMNRSAEADAQGHDGRIEVPVAGIQEMLTEALYNTRRFDVIEQKRIQEVEKQ
jgi:hypothetical protein